MNSTEACIALNMLPTMGPVRLRKLLQVFETPERILAARGSALRAIDGIGREVVEQITTWENMVDLPAELERIREFGAQVVRLNRHCIRGSCGRFMRRRSCCMSGAS